MNNFIAFFRFNFINFVNSEQNISFFAKNKTYILMNDDDLNLIFDEFLQKTPEKNIVVVCKRPLKVVLRECLKFFKLIKAAGGIVSNPQGQNLLIYRNDRWDLPKGKVEDDETIKMAALREVNEETGVQNLISDNLIKKTYHIYFLYGEWILKQTSWYEMHIIDNQNVVPQTEEGITLAQWFDPKTATNNLNKSYAMLSFLINQR